MSQQAPAEGLPRLCPRVVASQPELALLLDDLRGQPAVAVDTESNSLYAYQERVCLIQISTLEADYLIDPLSGIDVTPLGQLFAAADVQKVFHAAEYDVMCLKRDYGFHFADLFDTMWTARILGWPRVGLGDILKTTFDVHTNKHYQRHDWGKRPLEPRALQYACMDTHYLLALRDIQAEALKQAECWEEALEVFRGVEASDPMPRTTFDPEGFWRAKGAFDLTRPEQALLSELYAWRDQEARRQDRPPFKVLGDQTLVALARSKPRVMAELKGISGLRTHHLRRYGEQLIQTVKRGARVEPPSPPSPSRRHAQAEVARFQALRDWRKQVAAGRGVEPDVVLSNAVLWAIAERNPRTPGELEQIEGLGTWKRQAYGQAIWKLLQRAH